LNHFTVPRAIVEFSKSVMLSFGTNNGPFRFDHGRVELIKGIDTPNGKAHFIVARETPKNADMRVSRQWQSVVEVHFFSTPTSRQFSATGR
jgi:hypothetical protein